ncbi:helix-turn-helix transcriptional regulator [Paenibacillus sp. IB182496]|uniref:Helix-turn-helix transcriptional regulator n=1 Tax=Paenibacillus sabuli TaxID=2772509 RepID=A0A927GUU7_9BACL|nr:AraC family transcriptional regulator [Paenibacillus sabuli]MBD2848535.1 helix-turn-helix transcriptional regulator [Paenibacillus sabuli]
MPHRQRFLSSLPTIRLPPQIRKSGIFSNHGFLLGKGFAPAYRKKTGIGKKRTAHYPLPCTLMKQKKLKGGPMKALRRLLAYSHTNKLFRRFMLSFSLMVIFPSLVASAATYTYIVNKFEQEAEKNHQLIKNQLAQEMDQFLGSLQSDMVGVVGSVAVERWINLINQPMLYERIEVQAGVEQHLHGLLDNKRIVDSAYIFVPEANIVIGTGIGAMSAAHYFEFLQHPAADSAPAVDPQFAGRHMMTFLPGVHVEEYGLFTSRLDTSKRLVSAVVSYPLNSGSPSAYLVVNLREEMLGEALRIDHYMPFETAILDEGGRLVAQSDELPVDGMQIAAAIPDGSADPTVASMMKLDDATQLSFIHSRFNAWTYVILIDLQTILAPAAAIRQLAIVFLILCTAIGLVVSLFLSRRLYLPIRSIKQQFEEAGLIGSAAAHVADENELQLIKRWTSSTLNEHASMNRRLSELQPLLHERLLNKLLGGEIKDADQMERDALELGMAFGYDRASAVIVVEYRFLKPPGGGRSVGEQHLILSKIKTLIGEALESEVWISQLQENRLSCIVQLLDLHKSGDGSREAEKIRQALSLFRDDLRATIALGPLAHEPVKLRAGYAQACALLEWRSLTREIEVLSGMIPEERKLIECFLSEEDTDKTRHMLLLPDTRLLAQTLSVLLDDMAQKMASERQMLQFGHDILNALIRVLGSLTDQNLELYVAWSHALSECADMENLKHFFTGVCQDIGQMIEDNENRDSVLGEIMAYIEAHYMEDLSMEAFADRCKMSLGHFSRSFKKASGVKYVDFVAFCRTHSHQPGQGAAKALRPENRTDREAGRLHLQQLLYCQLQKDGRDYAGQISRDLSGIIHNHDATDYPCVNPFMSKPLAKCRWYGRADGIVLGMHQMRWQLLYSLI